MTLDQKMRQVGQEYLQGIREELDLYEKIRNTIAGIMDVLADMNTLTPETRKGADFDQLYSWPPPCPNVMPGHVCLVRFANGSSAQLSCLSCPWFAPSG